MRSPQPQPALPLLCLRRAVVVRDQLEPKTLGPSRETRTACWLVRAVLCASLSSARPGRGSVGLNAGRLGRGAAGVHDGLGVGERGLAHPTNRLATAGTLAILLVGGEVERDEEEEVRAQDSYSGEGGKLFARALAHAGEVVEVGRDEVCPRGEVDEACKITVRLRQRGGTREETYRGQ